MVVALYFDMSIGNDIGILNWMFSSLKLSLVLFSVTVSCQQLKYHYNYKMNDQDENSRSHFFCGNFDKKILSLRDL